MTIHERLRKARKEAGFSTVKEAAERFDLNENTLASNENGNKPYGRKAAERYSEAFKVSLDWLLTGKGPQKTVPKKIIDIWQKIPVEDQDTAIKILGSLANGE